VVLTAEFAGIEEDLDTRAFIGVIWGTTVGLTLAHIFAFDVAARAFSDGASVRDIRLSMSLQIAAGTATAAVLTLPFLVLDTKQAVQVAAYMVAGFVGITGYGVARIAGRSSKAALGFGVTTLAAAAVVVSIKVLLAGH
jgi:VIT1/CCC1 family predicted Fe2+/Mn2+ transporter